MKSIPSPAFRRRLSCTIAALLLCPTVNWADTLFKENFDDLPYVNQESLPIGLNQIDSGQWHTKLDEGSSVLVTREHALSGSQSIAINTSASGKSAVIAMFGNGSSKDEGISSALRVRFSFYVTTDTMVEAFVYSPDKVLGYAQIVAQGQEPYVRGWFNGNPGDRRERIAANAWYTLEFRLPANPGPNSEYELRVWDSGQPEPEEPSARGKFYVPPTKETAYRLLNISNQKSESAIHLDDFLVETISE